MKSSQYKIYTTSSAAWDAMYHAIKNANSSIYWEIYILADDEVGARFFDLLSKKARQGLNVKLILDGIGSFSVTHNRIDSLRRDGVDVRFFHERKYRYRGWWYSLVTRTHRKILVIDEHVGFIGGVNIKKQMKKWLDIHVRIKGNVVRSLLRAFAKMYLICGGPKEAVAALLRQTRVRHNPVEFIYDNGNRHQSRMKQVYTQALLKARERVILFSPYYFPGKQFLRALWLARQRGVRVDLLIPMRTDLRIATYAAYTWFSVMARSGVKIHLSREMMHGKGIVVDDDWAVVGSTNIDQTGFHDNYEANIKIRNKKIVRKLRAILNTWMIHRSDKFNLGRWEKRGILWRLKEFGAYTLFRIWHSRL